MSSKLSLLCPVDFSPASLGALQYALAIARRFDISVTALTVDDRLLADAGDARMGEGWTHDTTECQLRAFVAQALYGHAPVAVDYEVRIGKAAEQILEAARERGAHLIVMSTHGRSGFSKLALGSTAERVLRDTSVPVLLSPKNAGQAADVLSELQLLTERPEHHA
jgi:nucleotide-binding universal stress UspA family protein